jgi:malate:Na+ symporter
MRLQAEVIPGHTHIGGHIALAGITAIPLYVVGMMCFRLFDFPAPVALRGIVRQCFLELSGPGII